MIPNSNLDAVLHTQYITYALCIEHAYVCMQYNFIYIYTAEYMVINKHTFKITSISSLSADTLL